MRLRPPARYTGVSICWQRDDAEGQGRQVSESGFVIEGMCRGDGKIYYKLRIDAARLGGADADAVRATAVTPAGAAIPCAVYRIGFPGEDVAAARAAGDDAAGTASAVTCVVAVPMLDATNLTVTLALASDGLQPAQPTASRPAHLARFTVKPLHTKIVSRLTYRRHPELAAQIRGIDQRRLSGAPYIYVTGIFPSENPDAVVCRFHATFPFRESAEYRVQVVDAAGRVVDAHPLVLEHGTSRDRNDAHVPLRELSYSLRIPAGLKALCISVEETRKGGDSGADVAALPFHANFTCLTPAMFDGFLGGAHGLLQHAAQDPAYPQWLEKHRATSSDVRRQRALTASWGEDAPRFGLVCVVRDAAQRDLMPELLRSLAAQSYARFDLVLVTPADDDPALRGMALQAFGGDDERVRVVRADGDGLADWTNAGVCAVQGDFVGFLELDMVLEPDALYRYASAVLSAQEHAEGDAASVPGVLYCDEDRVEGGRYVDPRLKPGLNPDLLYAGDYMGAVLMVSRAALERMELPDAAVADAATYHLALQGVERAVGGGTVVDDGMVAHVPHVLVHRRRARGASDAAVEAGRMALERHWARVGVSAQVTVSDAAVGEARYRTAYRHAGEDREESAPKVSVVIPTKDNVPLLRTCLDAVFANTDYPDFDVTVVENNSVEEETFRFYDELEAGDRPVRVVRWPGTGFNYSAICNYGAAQCDGELLLFLNNDTEVIDRGWMASMAGFFTRPEVGVVGARLLYRDGLVQHGGVWVAPDGCEYINQNFNRNAEGYMGTLRFPYDAAAVTGACQMIRRSVFEAIGGFDEELAVAYNDVDLCLRAGREGTLTVFDPDALLYHNEYGTRGRDGMNPKGRARIMREESRFRARWVGFPEGLFIGANLVQRDGHFKLQW